MKIIKIDRHDLIGRAEIELLWWLLGTIAPVVVFVLCAHGGYWLSGLVTAVILFAACFVMSRRMMREP